MKVSQFSSQTLNLISEALTHVYWKKVPQKKFIQNLLKQHSIEIFIDWDQRKREISDTVINKLAADQTKYFHVISSFIEELCNFEDFSHLNSEEDAAQKVAAAKNAVGALRKNASNYLQTLIEKKESQKRSETNKRRVAEINTFNKGLEELKAEFFGLYSLSPQQKGFALEKFLRNLFQLFDLDPKASFKIQGEQIDGAFSFDGSDFLLEAKWEQAPLAVSSIYEFVGKVTGKLDNTLAFVVSMSGYGEDCIAQIDKQSRKVCLLADGADIIAVLESRISLEDLITRKKRYAVQTGKSYLPVSEILN